MSIDTCEISYPKTNKILTYKYGNYMLLNLLFNTTSVGNKSSACHLLSDCFLNEKLLVNYLLCNSIAINYLSCKNESSQNVFV